MSEVANSNRQITAHELTQVIANLRRAMRRTQHDLFADRYFTASEYEFLRYVADHERVRVGIAAEALSIAPNTASTIVKRLLKMGVIERNGTTEDRRVGELSLTDFGRSKLLTLIDHRVSVLVAAFEKLDHEAEEAINLALPALYKLIDTVSSLEANDVPSIVK
ncbi:MAG: MarR family winged helix-turn-helix transcriptional regulator [Actinomycetota bacterium]|nr:MarR family winged helix-turn-helix transcriptional regulator [Actinomycetota bacterium]